MLKSKKGGSQPISIRRQAGRGQPLDTASSFYVGSLKGELKQMRAGAIRLTQSAPSTTFWPTHDVSTPVTNVRGLIKGEDLPESNNAKSTDKIVFDGEDDMFEFEFGFGTSG